MNSNWMWLYLPLVCRRSSIGTFIRPHSSDGNNSSGSGPPSGGKLPKAPAPRLDYRSMVSIDDMPELFASFDSEYSIQLGMRCNSGFKVE